MHRVAKKIVCLAAILFYTALPAFSAETPCDPWIGTWTVKMLDNSKVTWELQDTWISPTGKSSVIWGVQNPGTVEILIVYLQMFDSFYYYEAPYGTTSYDLPQDLSTNTKLVPSEDFQSFTASPGKYPIKSGYMGTVPPSPCAASYLLGADNPKLEILREFRDRKLARSAAGRALIQLYYEKSGLLIALCKKKPELNKTLSQLLGLLTPVLQ